MVEIGELYKGFLIVEKIYEVVGGIRIHGVNIHTGEDMIIYINE